MNGKVLIRRDRRNGGLMTAVKVFALVGMTWGVAYPALLWSLKHLIR